MNADDVLNALDDGTEAERRMRRFYPLIAESAFGDASLAGVPVAFDLENEDVHDLIDELAIRIRDISDTTREKIRSLIDQQVSEGWGNDQLAKAIREAGDVLSRSRSTTIARTETGTGYNRASLVAYRQGGVTHVQVLDGDDDEPCASANGSIWTLEEANANPLGHPNCTRAFSPIVE